jgi:hypothetical protein
MSAIVSCIELDLIPCAGYGQQAPVEYSRISAWEMVENCVIPTSLQMVQGLFSLFILAFIFRLVVQLRRASK